MDKYDVLLRSLRGRKDLVGKLVDVQGTKMKCLATLVKFTEEDRTLLAQLEPENPLAHALRKPFEKTDVAKIQHEIDDIRPGRQLSTNLAHLQESSLPGKGIKFEVDGETFNIHASNLQKYAFAIRCKLDVLVRVSGSDAQFFIDIGKELALAKPEKGIMSCFYNKVFEGHFGMTSEGWLILYDLDSNEFRQELPEGTKRTFCFHCTIIGCSAVIHLACFGDQVRIRFINHSPELAHSHDDWPARSTIEDISYTISTQQKGHSPLPKNFPDKEFVVDASECYYSTSKAMIKEPGTNFTFKSTHPPNVYGVTTFYCSSNAIYKCESKAYQKRINGQLKFKFGPKSHNHAEPLSEPKNRSRLNAKQLTDDVFTLDLVQVSKVLQRTNTKQETADYLLENGPYKYNFHGRNVNAKNTTWWCHRAECKAKILKRDINGKQMGYFYTDDHTCDTDEQQQQQQQPQQEEEEEEEGASASGIQMEVEGEAEMNTDDVKMK